MSLLQLKIMKYGSIQSMTSQLKFVSHSQRIELILDLQHIRKPVIEIMHQLHLSNRLPIFPFDNLDSSSDPAKQLISKSMQFQGVRFRRSCMSSEPLKQVKYALNNNEALQLIWKGALFDLKKAFPENQMKDLQNNQYIGEMNNIQSQIDELSLSLSKLQSSKRANKNEVNYGKEILNGLIRIKGEVDKRWRRIRHKQRREMRELERYPYASLFRLEMSDNQKEMILPYIKRKIIQIDEKLLKDSILFIFEISPSECIVTLESPYKCFKIKQEDAKHMLGDQIYDQGIKDYDLAKKNSQDESPNFRKFKLCHKCLDIKPCDQQRQFLCMSNKVGVDPTLRPFVFQNILLYSDFSAASEVYKPQATNIFETSEAYIYYGHPFFKTYTINCGRYLCSECLLQYQHLKRSKKSAKKQMEGEIQEQNSVSNSIRRKGRSKRQSTVQKLCPFCECMCDCDRCGMTESFNRFVAYYQAHGGNFMDQVLPELVFLNFRNKKYQMSEALSADFRQWKSYESTKALQKMRQLDFTIDPPVQRMQKIIPEVINEKVSPSIFIIPEQKIVTLHEQNIITLQKQKTITVHHEQMKRKNDQLIKALKEKIKMACNQDKWQTATKHSPSTETNSSKLSSRKTQKHKLIEKLKCKIEHNPKQKKKMRKQVEIINLTSDKSISIEEQRQNIFDENQWAQLSNNPISSLSDVYDRDYLNEYL